MMCVCVFHKQCLYHVAGRKAGMYALVMLRFLVCDGPTCKYLYLVGLHESTLANKTTTEKLTRKYSFLAGVVIVVVVAVIIVIRTLRQ